MKPFYVLTLLMLTLILTACSAATMPNSQSFDPAQEQPAVGSTTLPTPTDDPAILATLIPNTSGKGEMTRADQQGVVMMEVTPLNLDTPAETLEFSISMNTHSVDLSMDLAALATLTTDTGLSVPATLWDAPRGGHHVQGKLVFAAIMDGKSILEGASKITLTILNVDVPSRVFEWELK